MKDLLATIDLYDDDTPGMADGGRIGFDSGGKGRFSKDTNKGKLREYLKNLRKESTINRQELAKKFGMEKATGSVTQVLNEFKNKNFKFVNLTKGVKKEGRKIEFTTAQKKLPMLLFGKTEDELTSTQRSNITTGKIDANTMTPYRVRQIYNPFSLKEYGKDWNDLTELEKDRVRKGLPPVDPDRIPTNKVKVQNELLELSKDPEIMDIFENPNRTKSQYTKDLTKVKKILGKNTNAVARLTQLAAAISGDDPVPGIPTKLKKGADFIYNNLPHTKTQRELDELKIGKIFGEKSIKTTKAQITKTPTYIFTGDYNIDEPAGVTSSVRRGTTPYAIFGQIIKKDINIKDKLSFDGNKSKKEEALQNAIKNAKNKGIDIKTDKNVKIALDDFNKLVSDYEQKINKNVPKGDLKVKLFRASLDSPENTIKNFNKFDSNYQKVFLNNYKNKGYSFNVPSDIKTIPQIAKDIQKPNILKKITERANLGANRLYSQIPVLTDLFNVAKSIPGDVAKKSYFKAAGKALGLAFTPVMIYDTYKAFEKGKPVLEALEQGLIGTDAIGGTKRILSLTPEERLARSVVKQDELKDLNVDMPMGFGFIEGPTPDTDMTLEQALAAATAGEERVKKLEAEKNLQRSRSRGFGTPVNADEFLAGGGIAGLSGGIDKGPQRTSMNPDSQGLRSLENRVRNL